VLDADRKGAEEIAAELRVLGERVAAGRSRRPSCAAHVHGLEPARAPLHADPEPPQAAILALGALESRAVVRDGAVVARDVIELTLVSDHRILYGEDAAAFLGRVREYLASE
jgi:pyruvate dehydrogenase E2 component (dihydrolipoamide acetyltransferase)